MEQNERPLDDVKLEGSQINLVVNAPDTEEDSVDLGRVFHNMKVKSRVFAWVLVLCLVVGICAPLLLYQFSKPKLTVSSVVTLQYEVPIVADRLAIERGVKTLEEAEFQQVSDLTAPDGKKLDVNLITSSYVLSTALDQAGLVDKISVESLQKNIRIETVLTEESRRVKESLAGLAGAKNPDVYERLQTAQMKYEPRFVVFLTNGFEDEDNRVKTELTGEELQTLLNEILVVYNDYLARSYADIVLPGDEISLVDIESLDVLEALDQLKAGVQSLYDYCDKKSDTVKDYRSWKTGRSLRDWMETLNTFQSINLDYLYSMVSENAITRDKDALLTSWRYMRQIKQNTLDSTNEKINEVDRLLANYKNDEVYISMQESDAAKTTRAATEYYNTLVLQQLTNYEEVAKLRTSIADYDDRIARLEKKRRTAVTEDVETELARSLASAQALSGQIRDHLEELFETPLYTTYADHSAAQGKLPTFIEANLKKMLIGAAIGAVLACGLWFLAALAPEFSRRRKEKETGKEEAE